MLSRDPARSLLAQEIRIPLPSRSSSLVLAALAGLALFFLRQAVFEGRVFYERDLHLQWYGQVQTFVRSVMAGSWPLWDPYVSFGQPLLANANNQILYPPTWLHLIMRPWTYYTLFLGAHLVFSGYGVVRLGERLGLSTFGALVAATLWMASGPFLSLGNAWNHFAAAAWIPWVLLAAEVTWRRGGARPVLAWAAVWSLQVVTGSPDVVFMTFLLVAACALRHWDWRRWVSSSNRRVASSTLAAGTVALALSAAQWVPSLELASRSDRWNMEVAQRTYWSVHPAGLLQTIVPIVWYQIPLAARWREALFEGREPFLFSLYLGVPMLALAALAVGRSREPWRWIFLGTGVGATLVALGRYAPFYGLAVRVVPPLSVLRFPAKALILTAFCMAILAGAGLDAWREPGTRRRFGLAAALGVALVADLLCLALLRFDADTWGPLFLAPPANGMSYGPLLAPVDRQLTWVAALLVLLLGLLAARAVGSRVARGSAVLVALVALSDLAWHNRQVNKTASRDLFTLRPEAVSAIDQRDLRRLYVYDYSMVAGRSLRHLGRATPYVTPGFRRDTPFEWAEAFALRMYLLPPIGAAWGLYGSYERDNLGIQPTPLANLNSVLVYADGGPLQVRLLRLAAVSQALALHTAGLEGLELVRTLPGPFFEPIRVFKVPHPLPRTYMVGAVRVADGDPALDALADPSFDLSGEIVLPSGGPRRAPPGFRGDSHIVEMRPDRVGITSESSDPGYVVLVDAYDPGWRARVDGRTTPVLRANVAFRAVAVPAGRHRVELVYRPRSALLGAGISGAAVAAIGLFLAGAAIRAPRGALAVAREPGP